MRLPDREPVRPAELDAAAAAMLERIGQSDVARDLVIGGGIALNHYIEPRNTHDLDLWYSGDVVDTRTTNEALRAIVRKYAEEEGAPYRERVSSTTASFELAWPDRQFAVQVARRDLELDQPVPGPWAPLRIETLRDNLGAKMNALVDRGAPRDFIDVKRVVSLGIATTEQCWALWSAKNDGRDVATAKANVLKHLVSIEQRRPLEAIVDEDRRRETALTRSFFRERFASLGRVRGSGLERDR